MGDSSLLACMFAENVRFLDLATGEVVRELQSDSTVRLEKEFTEKCK